MKYTLAILLLFATLFAASFAHAQGVTISPLNDEFGKKAKGEFSLTNNGFTPLSVTIDTTTMKMENGQLRMLPLDSSSHIKLSEYSARIPAKQVHTFAYEIKCDILPCAVVISAAMASGHTDTGLAVSTRLGTVAYICEKQKGCRQSFLKP